MTPELVQQLMAALQNDLRRAVNGLPVFMPRERAIATLTALDTLDRRALIWTGGAK